MSENKKLLIRYIYEDRFKPGETNRNLKAAIAEFATLPPLQQISYRNNRRGLENDPDKYHIDARVTAYSEIDRTGYSTYQSSDIVMIFGNSDTFLEYGNNTYFKRPNKNPILLFPVTVKEPKMPKLFSGRRFRRRNNYLQTGITARLLSDLDKLLSFRELAANAASNHLESNRLIAPESRLEAATFVGQGIIFDTTCLVRVHPYGALQESRVPALMPLGTYLGTQELTQFDPRKGFVVFEADLNNALIKPDTHLVISPQSYQPSLSF